MPKMKSRSSVKKRFKVTGTGKIVRHCCNAGHIKTKKSSQRKRRLSRTVGVSPGAQRRVRRFLAI